MSGPGNISLIVITYDNHPRKMSDYEIYIKIRNREVKFVLFVKSCCVYSYGLVDKRRSRVVIG